MVLPATAANTQHTALPTGMFTVTGVTPGTHYIALRADSNTNAPANDRMWASVTVVPDTTVVQTVDLGDTSWITPTFQNGWAQYAGWDAAGYRRFKGVVYLKGLIASGTTTNGTVIFNLPAGFRPAGNKHIPVASNALFGLINIMSNGDVKVNTPISNAWLSLEVPPFPADN